MFHQYVEGNMLLDIYLHWKFNLIHSCSHTTLIRWLTFLKIAQCFAFSLEIYSKMRNKTYVASTYCWVTSSVLSLSTGLFFVSKSQLSWSHSFTDYVTLPLISGLLNTVASLLVTLSCMSFALLSSFFFFFWPKSLIKSHRPRVCLLCALKTLYSFLSSYTFLLAIVWYLFSFSLYSS